MYACTHVCMYGWMDVWMDVHVHTCRKHVYGIIISLWISRFQVHTMQSVHWLGFLRCLTVPLFRSTCGFRDFGLGFWGVLVLGFAIHLQFDYTLNSTAAFQTYRRLLWESVHLIKDLIGLGFRVITTPPRTSYCKALRPRFNSRSLSLSFSLFLFFCPSLLLRLCWKNVHFWKFWSLYFCRARLRGSESGIGETRILWA